MLGAVITKAFILAKDFNRISVGSFVIMVRLVADLDNSKKLQSAKAWPADTDLPRIMRRGG
jgi:hypothetical protein